MLLQYVISLGILAKPPHPSLEIADSVSRICHAPRHLSHPHNHIRHWQDVGISDPCAASHDAQPCGRGWWCTCHPGVVLACECSWNVVGFLSISLCIVKCGMYVCVSVCIYNFTVCSNENMGACRVTADTRTHMHTHRHAHTYTRSRISCTASRCDDDSGRESDSRARDANRRGGEEVGHIR